MSFVAGCTWRHLCVWFVYAGAADVEAVGSSALHGGARAPQSSAGEGEACTAVDDALLFQQLSSSQQYDAITALSAVSRQDL